MDVIIEGKITAEEGLDGVLQTLIELKSVERAILRINSFDEHFQGKIGFAIGGYILGARIEETGEIGYSAVRKLLLVQNGNYAILDPEKQNLYEISQSLWIDASKLLNQLPDLPPSPETFQNPDAIQVANPMTEQYDSAALSRIREEKIASVRKINSPARQFVIEDWRLRYAIAVFWAVVILIVTAIGCLYADHLAPFIQSFIK